jgi:hypothetical protein
MPDLLVIFQHALGRLDGRDDYYRHSADHPCKKEVLKERQNMVHQEVHSQIVVLCGGGIKGEAAAVC